jgi:antitoxin MazE
MKVTKVEGGLVVQIPAEVAETLQLKAGDEVAVRVAEDGAIEISREDQKAALLAEIKALARPLPADWRFDRDDASAR